MGEFVSKISEIPTFRKKSLVFQKILSYFLNNPFPPMTIAISYCKKISSPTESCALSDNPSNLSNLEPELWAVMVSTPEGYRFQHEKLFESENAAEGFKKSVISKPFSTAGWLPSNPVYGSKAYCKTSWDLF
jgi:hypothetical protein